MLAPTATSARVEAARDDPVLGSLATRDDVVGNALYLDVGSVHPRRAGAQKPARGPAVATGARPVLVALDLALLVLARVFEADGAVGVQAPRFPLAVGHADELAEGVVAVVVRLVDLEHAGHVVGELEGVVALVDVSACLRLGPLVFELVPARFLHFPTLGALVVRRPLVFVHLPLERAGALDVVVREPLSAPLALAYLLCKFVPEDMVVEVPAVQRAADGAKLVVLDRPGLQLSHAGLKRSVGARTQRALAPGTRRALAPGTRRALAPGTRRALAPGSVQSRRRVLLVRVYK